MKKLIAFAIAIIIHVAILFGGNAIYRPAEIYLQQGQSSIEMNLVPSIESRESKEDQKKKESQNEQEERVVPTEIVEQPELLEEVSTPEENLEQNNIEEVYEVEHDQVTVTEDVTSQKEKANKEESILKESDHIKEQEITKNRNKKKKQPIVKKLQEVIKQNPVKEKIVKEKQTKEKEIHEKEKSNKLERNHDIVENVSPSEEKSKSDSNAPSSTEIVADILTKGITAPTIEGVSKPRYPSSCRRKAHEGVCILEATIDSKGNCTKISISQSAGCEKLNKSAIKALKRARFSPAKSLGINITSTKKVAFKFKIEDVD